MRTVKDIARLVTREAWNLPDDLFETLWMRLSTMPALRLARRDDIARILQQPALASTDGQSSPVTMALCLFVLAATEADGKDTIEGLTRKILRWGEESGCKGVAKRVTITMEAILPSEEATTAPAPNVATAYTRDGMRELSAEELEDEKRGRDRYAIFIHHHPHLPARVIGEVYFAPDYETPRDLPPLEYRILVHLLQYHHEPNMRHLEAIVEGCWQEVSDGKPLSGRASIQRHGEHKYHRRITQLNRILEEAGVYISFVSRGTGTWRLVDAGATPTTFCLVLDR